MHNLTSFRLTTVVAALALLAACDAPQVVRVGGVITTPNTQTLDAFARSFMDTIQADSISESREFCGFFVKNGGTIAATAPRRGTEASCNYGPTPATAIASYHTHGSYGENYDNEVPSFFDLLSSREVGFDDYVSTPGGRLWRVDGDTGDATQLCGLGCLTSDPGFVPRDEDNVLQNYTIETMGARQNR